MIYMQDMDPRPFNITLFYQRLWNPVIQVVRSLKVAAPAAPLGQPPPEVGLVTLSQDQCVVKKIESGSAASGGGVERLVFASSGAELLGALQSGATFLWSRVKITPHAVTPMAKPGGATPHPLNIMDHVSLLVKFCSKGLQSACKFWSRSGTVFARHNHL